MLTANMELDQPHATAGSIAMDPRANSISPSSSSRSFSQRGRPGIVTVHDLPPDVLIYIFGMVCSMSPKHPAERHGFADDLDEEDIDKTFCDTDESPSSLHHTLFPYALVAVHPTWKDALSVVSTFWTHLVIYVDVDPTPLCTISEYLALSAEHPLDITILSRRGVWSEAGPRESVRVVAVLDLLSPHMSRWRSLHIDVQHYTSIPTLQGEVPHLVDLHLCAKQHEVLPPADSPTVTAAPVVPVSTIIDVHRPWLSDRRATQADSGPAIQLCAPRLTSLHADSDTFLHAFISSPHTLRNIATFTLSRPDSHSTPDSCTLTLRSLIDCVRAMPALRHLVLLGVDPHADPDEYLPPEGSHLQAFTFVHVSAQTMPRVLRQLISLSLTHIRLRACGVPRWVGSWSLEQLVLEELGDAEDVLHLLTTLPPQSLVVKDCEGFGAHVLSLMAVSMDGWMCPALSELRVIRCFGCSSGDVRRMVEARSREESIAHVERLRVEGCSPLQPEDEGSIRECVDICEWAP